MAFNWDDYETETIATNNSNNSFNWDDYETETPKKQTVKPLPKKEIKTQNHSPSYNEKPQETQETANTTPYVIEGGISKNVQYRNEHPIKESVRQAGRNTARFLLPENAENWLLGSKEDEAFLKEYENKDIKSYDELRADYDAGKISKDDFLIGIDLRNKLDIAQAEDDYRQERNKNIGKGAVDIGSGFIPVGGGAKIAAKGAQLLRPLAGRKAAQAISQGIVGGALGGGAMGLGEGLIDRDINPLKQAAIDAGVGAIGGAAFGGAIAKGTQLYKANKLRNAKTDNLTKQEIDNLREQAKNYYDDYLYGTSVKRKDLGKIEFLNAGIDEQTAKGLHNVTVLPDLKKQIKKGTYQGTRKDYPREDIKQFHIIENKLKNKDMEYQIAEDVNGNKYWFIKDVTNNKKLPPTYRNQNPGSGITSNNIIPDNAQNLNPNVTKYTDEFINQGIKDRQEFQEELAKTIKKIDSGKYTNDDIADLNMFINEIENEGAEGTNKYVVKELREKYKNLPLEDYTTYMNRTEGGNVEHNTPIPEIYKNTVNEVKSIVPENLKPTRNLDMPETIYNEKTAKAAQKGIQKDIGDMIEKPAGLDYVNRRYKNRFYKENISDPLTQGIHDADVEINSILKEIKNNPEIVNNPENLAEFEERIANKTGFPDEELNAKYYEKYYNALEQAYNYNKVGQDLNLSNTAREAGEIKPSMLAQGADNPEELVNIRKELKKQGRLPEYEVLHNADLQLQADEAIKNNFSNTYAGLLGKAQNKQSELSALDFETARQTISRLYQEGRTAEALELTEQISKKATQAGQAVQALSLWHKTTKEGAVQQAQKIISEYNKTHKKKVPPLSEEQIAKINELTKNIQKTEPGTRENLVATQLLMKYQKELIPASAGSKLRTLQNINLLLNAKTFLRNAIGNAIFSGMENIASKPLAAGIDKIIGLRTKQQTRVLPRLNEYLKGMGQGFKEGVEDVGMGINTRDGIGQRFNLNDRRSFTGVPVLEQAEKALNYSLQVPDRMFYQATLNESLANQMRAAGVDKPTAKMIKQATDEALESVYQNRGILGNAVLKARQAGNEFGNINGYGLGDALIPYAQTPANVVQQGINYSPLGAIKGIVNLKQGNQRQASLDFARALVGSGLMGGGYAAAKNGLINPAIDDYKAKNNYQVLGIRPNTINIGDSNISFNQLQPLSAPLTAGANLADFQEGNAINAIDRTLDSIADLSMLQSYNKFVKDMSEYGKGTAALNLAGSIPSRFTTPTYLKQINTYFDPYLRETYDPNPIIQAENNIISGIPGASKKLPLKYDVTGQPIAKYGTEGNWWQNALNTFVNPVFANQKKDDATMQKLIDLYEQTGDKSVLMPMAAKQISFKDLQGNKVKRKLSGREVSQYQQQMGVVNKQLLDGILNTELYNMLDDDDKVKVINDTQRYVKNYIDEMLFDKPNAQKRNIIRKLSKNKQDEVVNKILKVYKNKVLPIKTNEIYKENFAQ